MTNKRLIGAIASALAAAAITAGVALGSGSTSTPTTSNGSSTQPAHAGPPGMGMGAPAVHSVSVVLNKAKTAYITQTSDRGTIESVDASAATITVVEGTRSLPYKTVTLSGLSDATITLDGKTSALSNLTAGEHVSVSSSSDGTVVMAMDSSVHPEAGSAPSGAPAGQAPPSGGPPSTGATTTG